MAKILITGAAGFIGSQLAYRLWKNKDEVILIDNFSYGKEDNLIFDDCDFRDSIIKMDIRDKESIAHLFEENNFDIVYHIAAITPLPDCQTNPQEALDVNVTGTINILENARIYGARKVIFASTSAVYENDTEFPSVEGNNTAPSLIYPSTKYTCEQFCKAYAEVYGMNIVCLRFANVYGPHIDCLRKQPPVAAYIIRELYYDRIPQLHSTGEQQRDFIYVEDLIELALAVQDGEGFDVVNVSSNETHSINEMFKIIAEIMGKEGVCPQYHKSAHFWAHYPNLYTGKFTISEKALANEVNKYTLLSNEHAKEKYNWSPKVSFYDGLKDTIDFTCEKLSSL